MKRQNSLIMAGRSYMDSYNISQEAATKLGNVLPITGDQTEQVLAWYEATEAINLADYNGFPIGSVIFDMQAHMIHEKLTATTWGDWSTVQGDSRPYKVYTALLKQSGTNPPIATVLENTLGFLPTWIREGSGIYYINESFDIIKTVVIWNRDQLQQAENAAAFKCYLDNDEYNGSYKVYIITNSSDFNGDFYVPIEIRVYD